MAMKRGKAATKSRQVAGASGGTPAGGSVQSGPVKVGTIPEWAVSRMVAQSAVMSRIDQQRQAVDLAELELSILVGEARRLGLSWASIGEAAGVDRETLRRRYGANASTR